MLTGVNGQVLWMDMQMLENGFWELPRLCWMNSVLDARFKQAYMVFHNTSKSSIESWMLTNVVEVT
jgi:hypothetical protein